MSESYQEPLVYDEGAADLQAAMEDDEAERSSDKRGCSRAVAAASLEISESSQQRAHRWVLILSDQIRPMIDNGPNPPEVA